ncbi:hypothetical protein ABIF00_009075 [Bradyrhizobium elkanii]
MPEPKDRCHDAIAAPTVALQLVTMMIRMSLLAVAVVSVG